MIHAELVMGEGFIMIGPANSQTEYGKVIKHPQDLGGVETQAPFVFIQDVEAHYQQAKSAGAEMILELKLQDYGAMDYTCRDLEGHIWSFGNYDPWNPPKF